MMFTITYITSGATLSFELSNYTVPEASFANITLMLTDIPSGGLQRDITITLGANNIGKTGD